MYYKRVNRGLTFTKPGVYAFGLVLLVGIIAVTTGMNGLYVFLSAGLGGFIVSGLLSEKAMKSCHVTQVRAMLADADQPFPLSFTIANSSGWFSVFAVQNRFMLALPAFRLIAAPRPAFASARFTRIPPASALTYEAMVSGMPRGNYQKVLAMQLTTFPFGILEKFKVTQVPASLIVAPAIDRAFLDELRALLRSVLGLNASDRTFYCHRSFVVQNGTRDVDWRKSAGREPGDWVVKQYKATSAGEALTLDAAWAVALAAKSPAAFEGWLVRVRTAIKALDETSKTYVVDFGGGFCVPGAAACLELLAEAPRFEARNEGLKTDRLPTVASAGSRLVLREASVEWRHASARASSAGGSS